MVIKRNGVVIDDFSPAYIKQDIIIAIDSSKSNTAIAVGNTSNVVLDDYEIVGGGSDINVYDLCRDTRKALKELFSGANILYVGIEDIITKKEHSASINIHQSRYKITAVFDNFMFLFEEYFGIRPEPINNETWKTGVIPKEFRKLDGHKASKKWFDSLGNKWAKRKDDVTDVVCIYWFIMKSRTFDTYTRVVSCDPYNGEFTYVITTCDIRLPEKSKKFIIDNEFDFLSNVMAIAGMISKDELAYVQFPIEAVPEEDLFSDKVKTYGKPFHRKTKEVAILVARN